MKVAIVTGANRGVGRSAALSIARRDTGVIITYNSHREEADAVVAEIGKSGGRAAALKLDVTAPSTFAAFRLEVERTLKADFDRTSFDYLVNNAGIAQRTLIRDVSEDQFDQLVNVHFKGPFFLTQQLIPLMTDGGHVVNVSSGLTQHAHPGTSVYAGAKGAMEVLTKYIAREYMERRIRSNIVAPGALDTDFGGGRTDEIRQMLSDTNVSGRMGGAEDIGPLIAALLVSEDFRWINGQKIDANGGTK